METINPLLLKDETIYPSPEILEEALEESYPAYLELLDIFKEYRMEPEWRYYNDGKAWLCKVQRKKKTIIWMSAWKGFMKVTVYYPLRIIDDIYNSGISKKQIDIIKETKNVGKSKPCIFELRDSSILEDIKKAIEVKI